MARTRSVQTWSLEDFRGGIDLRDGLFTDNQSRLRIGSNIWISKGRKIRRRPPLLQEDGDLAANCQGLLSIDGRFYTIAKKGESVTHTGGLAGLVQTLFFDNPDHCTDWELLDALVFDGYAAAWIRHTFPSAQYPHLMFLHVWDELVYAPTFVQDPYLPGSFSPSIADLYEQRYDGDFKPVLAEGVSKLWTSTLRGNTHCCRTADARVWNQRSQDSLLLDGEHWCFVVPEGAQVRSFIVPRNADWLSGLNRWAYYVCERKVGDAWQPMEEVSGTPSTDYTWSATAVSSRFAGGWDEIQVRVKWGSGTQAGLIRLRLVAGATSVEVVQHPTMVSFEDAGWWRLRTGKVIWRHRGGDEQTDDALESSPLPENKQYIFAVSADSDTFPRLIDITSGYEPNGWEREHYRFLKRITTASAQHGSTVVNADWDSLLQLPGTVDPYTKTLLTGTVHLTTQAGPIYLMTGDGTAFTTDLQVGDVIDVALAADTWATLTGTVDVTAGGDTITGSGTLFTAELSVGDTVRVNGEEQQIASISSDTAATIIGTWAATATGQAIERRTGKAGSGTVTVATISSDTGATLQDHGLGEIGPGASITRHNPTTLIGTGTGFQHDKNDLSDADKATLEEILSHTSDGQIPVGCEVPLIQVGDRLRVNTDERTIATISSNTELTVSSDWTNTGAGKNVFKLVEHRAYFDGTDTQLCHNLSNVTVGRTIKAGANEYTVSEIVTPTVCKIQKGITSGDFTADLDVGSSIAITLTSRPVIEEYRYPFEEPEASSWYTERVVEYVDQAGAEDALSLATASHDNTGGRITAISAIRQHMLVVYPGSMQLWAIDQDTNRTRFLDDLPFGSGDHATPPTMEWYGSILQPVVNGLRAVSVSGPNSDNLQDLNVGEPLQGAEVGDVIAGRFWPWYGQAVLASVLDGALRFWVLDYSRESKITAWSLWENPDWTATSVDRNSLIPVDERLYFRAGRRLCYFDATATVFRDHCDAAGDAYLSDALLHFNDMRHPGRNKKFVGFDIVQEGTCTLSFQLTPYGSWGVDGGPVVPGPVVEGITYGRGRRPLAMVADAIAPRLQSRDERGWQLHRLALDFRLLSR